MKQPDGGARPPLAPHRDKAQGWQSMLLWTCGNITGAVSPFSSIEFPAELSRSRVVLYPADMRRAINTPARVHHFRPTDRTPELDTSLA